MPLRSLLFALMFVGLSASAQQAHSSPPPPPPIAVYIHRSWGSLQRSMTDCASFPDAKVQATGHAAPILYLPAEQKLTPALGTLQQHCNVRILHLPRRIRSEGDLPQDQIPTPGLLYLPNPYVVPGGRFNEMYGWDSYFIILGLEHDNRRDLAKGMVENFFYEIQNYGAILNANRTYFFTRSQPPFLSSMIREVYEHPAPGTQPDRKWLARAYSFAQRDYALWISPEHRAGDTGLARYFDLGEGPVPEMADDSSYYPDVIRWLLAHPADHPGYLVPSSEHPTPTEAAGLATTSCDITTSRVCAQAIVDNHRLSAAFYLGDRAMRESGFDPTFRFGPFSGSTQDYAPSGLNSLIYKYELDMAHFATLLGHTDEATQWTQRAAARRAAIDKYLWNATAGMYYDYNFVTGTRNSYNYITTFYPLWAHAASPAQAAAVRSNLKLLEQEGGIQTSDTVTGVQWDAPYGWAPVTWLAVSGLDQNGFHQDATRIAGKFTSTILTNFLRDGTIREKYNVASGSANIKMAVGYKSNIIGFGWTNAIYLKLEDLLTPPTHP